MIHWGGRLSEIVSMLPLTQITSHISTESTCATLPRATNYLLILICKRGRPVYLHSTTPPRRVVVMAVVVVDVDVVNFVLERMYLISKYTHTHTHIRWDSVYSRLITN